MDIDNYLNELQANLDDQLSKFGISSSEKESQSESQEDANNKTFCPECGTSIPEDATFCPNCGFRITTTDEQDTKEDEEVIDSKKMPDECDDCDNEEKSTRTVEVSVYVRDLSSVLLTPVSEEYATEHIQNGEEPDDMSDVFDFSYPVYFCNEESHLTVKDGDEEYTADELPTIAFSDILEYKNYDQEDLGFSDEEDFTLDKYRFESSEVYLTWLAQNADLNGISPVFAEYWRRNIEDDESVGFLEYVKMVVEDIDSCNENDYHVNYMECGSVGKSQMTFYIEIPEDEKFDMEKLHFFSNEDWADNDPYYDEFDVFMNQSILLDYVEYDGRIYHCDNVFFSPGWKDYRGGRFVNPDLTEFELED